LTVPRIYFPGIIGKGEFCELGGNEIRYVKSVLRMKSGDHLIFFDGNGWEYEAVIRSLSTNGIKVQVLGKNMIANHVLSITVLQALPKGNKMDSIVQKSTELGASMIIPFRSTRSVPRLTANKARDKVTRWRSIAREAARQCRRADIPEIKEVLSFDEMLASSQGNGLKIIFWEEEKERSVKELLLDGRHEGVKDVSVIIGPEGGFSKEEVASAVRNGFVSASLGRYVLRVETAAVTILSIIQYELGIFRQEQGGGGL